MLDVVVVGGGIVGLATAYSLVEAGLDVAVLEKENRVAAHQSGRNSNVLHSGVYYAPGSLKATTVAAGRAAMQAFCAEHGIAVDACGKVIVAASDDELARLDALAERAAANGIDVERLGPSGLREVEPHVSGLGALRVASAALVDFASVCRTLASLVGDVRLSTTVVGLRERSDRVVVETTWGEVEAGAVVNCAGLQCDRVAALHRVPDVRIVPFRGEYHELVASKRHLVRTLVYPVPDPAFPFLGVHLTKGLDGGVHCGPNAVLATAREGYRRRDVRMADVRDTVSFAGFRPLVRRHWRTGAAEVARSLSRRRFARSLQRLVPEVGPADLVPALAGVRAQALAPDGTLVDDFVIRESARVVDVLNAPSPAATAALEIGRVVSEAARRHAAR